jgi:hypothetical protein
LFLVIGLVLGYVSLWLGPFGLILAALVFGLVVVQVRRFPERTGAYLVGVSLLPVIILGSIVSRMPACDGTRSTSGECYAAVTAPALIAYAITGVVGALLLGIFLRRIVPLRSPSS